MAGNWAQSVRDALSRIAESPSITWGQASTYENLPEPNTCGGSTWLVLQGTGIWPVNHPSGWYYSDGMNWAYLGAYNPVITGGNVVVTNLPTPASTGQGTMTEVTEDGQQILSTDSLRKGFVLTAQYGIIFIGLGFMPDVVNHTYRLTNASTVEKDGYIGPVYAISDQGSKNLYITEIK